MTEDEAKTKVCHRTLAALGVPEVGSFHQFGNCLGSDCMAWRFQYLTASERADFIQRQITLGDDREKALARLNILDGHDGYCGLAGGPSHD